MRTPLSGLLTIASLLLGSPAQAGLFEPVRSREPLPAREVERSLVLAKGWSQADLSLSQRTADGRILDALELDLAHGLAPGVHGWLGITHRVHRTDPDVAGDKRTAGLASAEFGIRGIVAQRDIGGSWLAWEAGYRAPFGNDHPGSRFRLPISASSQRLALALIGRQRAGAFRADLGVRGGLELPGVVGSGALPDGCAGHVMDAPNAWLGPGGELSFWGAFLLQGGPLTVAASMNGALWTGRDMRLQRAVDGEACPSGGAASREVRFGGQSAILVPELGVQLTRGVAVRGWIDLPLAGSNDQVWVERARGRRLGGLVEVAF